MKLVVANDSCQAPIKLMLQVCVCYKHSVGSEVEIC